MLSKTTAKLVEEIFTSFGGKDKRERNRKKAQEEPEVCLVSMLLVIKEELPHVYATLGMTIERAPYDDNLKEAREKLEETSQKVS